MSLMVYLLPISRSDDISAIESEIEPPFNFTFGFEVWRYEVWGCDVVKNMDCKLLPALSETISAFLEMILMF